ncbi:scaffold protein CheW associated with MCPs of class 36H [Syntrophotalea carbinolica DSM 2380]|uniref:Chemotaxis protein CheW n=2 Tax=Syntrophotalea carbinolica TaxID=19 RepID=Q3A741_SYNC1|nr:scaffold protein CheW associated with MCPs of class 36H [Syntrophotalea carbinolica DSM 2380]
MEAMPNSQSTAKQMSQASINSGLETAVESEDTMKDKFLTFWIADEEYGMGIEHVIEIIGVQKITKVPDMPHFIKGVINLRGRVIPVVDVRIRFGLSEREYDERTCIVVIQVNDQTTGMIVDRVNEVSNIPQDKIEKSHSGDMAATDSYILGIGKTGDSVKILLDMDKFMRH